jgi:ABC-type lipoprotein export system ATPase subunit
MTKLRLESVSKTYLRGRTLRRALSEVTLEVRLGEFVAVLGEQRSGKSTLLRVAAGVERPDSGSISYCERDLASMSERELADYRLHAVAWVCGSRPPLAGYRVLDYLALPALAAGGDRHAARRSAHDALETAGADDCSDAGLEELSEGERQRVEIAAALVRHPRIILADEPVAGLGAIEAREILGLLRDLAERGDRAVLMTASDAAELLGASRVVGLLSRGRLLEPRLEEEDAGESDGESDQRGEVIDLSQVRTRKPDA